MLLFLELPEFVNTHLGMRCAELNAVSQLSQGERECGPGLWAYSAPAPLHQPYHTSSFPLPRLPSDHLLPPKSSKALLKMTDLSSQLGALLPPSLISLHR